MSDRFLFYSKNHQDHFSPNHPERPERLEVVRSALIELGLWDICQQVDASNIPHSILEAVHSDNYLESLHKVCKEGGWLDYDTYTTPASWKLANQAVEGTVWTANAVWEKSGKGFVLVRPPGHHARRDQGMGFCLLNNVACAAEYLIQTKKASKLAIIDLDLHHGNGTQDIFWKRGDVFFVSVHQSNIFPLTGKLDETGAGEGKGTKVNIPLSSGSGDQAYQEITNTIILPLLTRFRPEMILVSYGFDTHWLDPLGSLNLSAEVYYEIILQLVKWANHYCFGKIMLVLEGGYDLTAAKVCTQAVVSALFEKEWSDPLGRSPFPETETWKKIILKAKTIWQI